MAAPHESAHHEAEHYQLVVIGAGPGGYVAAIRAAQLGLRTAIVERAELGGVCLNWGCIPTKSLLRSAEVLRLTRDAARHGVMLAEAPRFDLAAAVRQSRAVSAQLNRGVRGLLKKHRVTVIAGQATLLGQGRVGIHPPQGQAGQSRTLSAAHILVATGARARELPGFPFGGPIWSAREAMTPSALPRRLAIVGAGAIGVEFASFYAEAGSEVTLLEAAGQILPHEDAEIAGLLTEHLRKRGLTVLTGARVQRQALHGEGVQLHFEHGGQTHALDCDALIVAAGITGNIEHLGLENTRARTDRGHLVVDRWSATDEAGLYAIGDVAGPPWLAHKASHEAIACVERLAGLADARPLDPASVPACTYCHPQVASVGQTEAQARASGRTIRVGRFPFLGNGKALALGEPDGLVKTIFDADSGELLGAHLIGPDVTELIGQYVLARTLETTEAELMHTVFPHPTLSETTHEAVLAAFGRAIHF